MLASEVIIKITELIKREWMDFDITNSFYPHDEEITIYIYK